jgi:hypothetical protein
MLKCYLFVFLPLLFLLGRILRSVSYPEVPVILSRTTDGEYPMKFSELEASGRNITE